MFVNMEERPFKRNNKNVKQNIEIRVQIERTLSSGNCVKVLEDLLKYLLYQRNQIPIQYETLAKEVAYSVNSLKKVLDDGETSCDKSDVKQKNSQLEKSCVNVRQQRKRQIIKGKNERKQQRWMVKAQQFLEMFHSVMKLVNDEIESGEVASVNIVLGGSVMTAREIFTLQLPPGYSVGHNMADTKVNNKVAPQLFRSLIVNEDLVKLVTRRCTLQKVWILLQKKSLPSSNKTLFHQSINSSLTPSLLPLPDYKSSRLAQTVNIFLDHQPAPGTPMVLTPAVGHVRHSIFNSVKRSRRNLDLRGRTISENMGANEMEVEPISNWQSDDALHESLSKDDETSIAGESCFANKSKFAFMTPKPMVKPRKSISATPRTPWLGGLQSSIPVDETPTVKPTVSSVCSPAKRLASEFMQFNLIDRDVETNTLNIDEYAWYQIPFSIKGFKEVLVRS